MFEIVPYKSVGPIAFGATEAEVIQLVGLPTSSRMDPSGERSLNYQEFCVQLSPVSNTVIEVGLFHWSTVSILGVDIFRSQTAFRDLVELDGEPYEIVGFIVLFRLGITVTGLHDGDDAQRAVTAFERGRWDEIRPKMVKFDV